MQNGSSSLFLLIGAMMLLMVVPQLIARRRQKRKEEALKAGDAIVTIGGILGTLTYINFEQNLARVRLADGVEIRMLAQAISGKREEPTLAPVEDEAPAEQSEEEEPIRDEQSPDGGSSEG